VDNENGIKVADIAALIAKMKNEQEAGVL